MGHFKAQEMGNKNGHELMGSEKAKSLRVIYSLSSLLCGGEEMAPREGTWSLKGSSPRAPEGLSEVGLAQVADPRHSRSSPSRMGVKRERGGRESELSIL